MKKITIKTFLLFFLFHGAIAQESKERKKDSSGFSLFRANENYEYLKNKENNPYKENLFDAIKFIPLNQKKDIYLSFGGQFRPRFEHFSNRFWDDNENMNFYSQRIALHSDLVLGKHMRIFGELYHGYTSHKKEFTEYDEIDLHQAFIDFKLPLKNEASLSLRFGRQEMPFGATRLIGLREGPNIRRSFDATRFIYKKRRTNIQAFYGREVSPTFGAFDNRFTLFDGDISNPELWGLYAQLDIKGMYGLIDLYYLGFCSDQSTFNDMTADETRHTLGLRTFGKLWKVWHYNTEIIYQFGTLGSSDICAFDIETDWKYELINTQWKITPGLKFQYTSGDKDVGDGKINTFNPMFVNPAYYSLALTITPVNIIGVHPSISVTPTEKLNLYVEWAFFWRASKKDGLYRPPRFINRLANGVADKSLGNQIGFKVSYEINRYLSFDWDISYFIAGDFQKATGEGKNIFHFAPTLSYKF